MTNITLSIENSVYNQMKKYSEIKWSEFVRKSIKQRVDELEKIEKKSKTETLFSMLASETALKKDWLSKEDEEAWKHL